MRLRQTGTKRWAALRAGAAILGILVASASLASNFEIFEVTTGNYVLAVWQGTDPSLTWNLNFATLPTNVNENGTGVTPQAILANAFVTWQTAQSPAGAAAVNLSFTFGQASASLPQGPAVDCQNVIGFADPNAATDFGTGVIAFTSVATVNTQGAPSVQFNCGTKTGTCSIAGGVCIVDADIMFNPNATFATSAATVGQFDLQSVATHEIGHLIGLDHSNIAQAVMFPYGDTNYIGVRTALSTDDVLGASHLYPGAAADSEQELSGTITLNGSGVYAADVQAIDALTGNVVTERLTDPAGNYHLQVYDGTYYIYAQSLAPSYSFGPTLITNFNGQAGYGSISNPTNYTGKFY